MSSRNFNDFAATLSFYTGPAGTNNGSVFSGENQNEEQSKGLMGWARSSFDSVSNTANDLMMTRQTMATFAMLLAGGVFCMFLSLTFLPFLVLAPQKFATLFTLGSLLILGSFSVLKGHAAFISHLGSKDRLPFSMGYAASLIGTLYASMWSKGYFLTLFFSTAQVISLLYFLSQQKETTT